MKSRKLSTIVMVCLIAVLCGLGCYVVYAATNISFKATNRIIFNADSTKLYYTASVNVKYQDSSTILATDSINHSGEFGKQDFSKTQITFGDTINFTSEHRVIVYEITIANYTEQEIQVEVNKHEDTEYFTNTLNETRPVSLAKYVNGSNAKTTTFVITTTLNSQQFSFKYDNSFSIDLTLVNK